MRFRNRFTATPSAVHRCLDCGRVITVSGPPGAQTVIHEYPFCPTFEAALKAMAASDPNATMHQAAMLPETGETIILADGDSPEDVSY